MKTLTIIGAGISGLVCGVYAQRSGWKTLILEKAGNPGGVSTSWKRKGYTFEGGIHWLIGAKADVPLHDIWTESGALADNNPVFFKDPVYSLIDGDVRLDLTRNLKDLKKFAPEDWLPLALMRFHVWCFTFFHTPVQDLGGLKVKQRRRFSLMEFIKMGPAVVLTPWLMVFSAGTYTRRFRNPHLRKLLQTVVDPNINALSLIYTLSSFTSGDSGYPEGGSLRMAQNMADTFTKLGGEIRYRTPALEVVREGATVSKAPGSPAEAKAPLGVRTADGFIPSDAVIISADARTAIDKLFARPLEDRWARRMREKLVTAQCMFIALGVRADLSEWPRCMQIVLPEPLEAGGLSFDAITVNNYSRNREYAPEGCTAVTVILPGASYEFWKAARADGTYAALKKEATDNFIRALARAIPATEGKVEVTDMATPLTWERYCDTFEGSYMTEWHAGHFAVTAPVRYAPGIYFTGQRTAFSGGLPVAAERGRHTAQVLCKDYGVEFVSR